jgi:hypothetical protein
VRGSSTLGAAGGTGTVAAGAELGGMAVGGGAGGVAGGAGGDASTGTVRSGVPAVGNAMLDARAAEAGEPDGAPPGAAESPLVGAAARGAPSRPTANTALQTLQRARTPPSGILAGSTR